MAVEKEEAMWQSKILEIVNDGIVVLIEEDVMLSNAAFAMMLNYEPEELEDSTFEDLLHPSSKRFDRKMIDALYSGDDLAAFNTRLQSKEGDTVHVEVHPVDVVFEGE